ncbi:hypothetical protein O181_025105 [Austropuccinia psidii MF-1]|uniref:Uncharacterized protein n=1 Tax=Austropuccinia psidii MF-1 TaxID=1389203 RepID=A0A9Q3CLT5_9BASI|nr:hypothetical protein [Austropuccinia psidii MF-1]
MRSHNKPDITSTLQEGDKSMPETNKDGDVAIDCGINMIKPEHILRIDGSNFQSWERRFSVPDPIQDSIITMRPCHTMYMWLKNHYFVMTRTSQCIAFNRLMSIELKDSEAPSSLVLRLNEALIELKN